jgi:hypothetical protein
MIAPAGTRAVRGALLDGVNSDGGWGYGRGKASRLEPTCWAMLALADDGDAPDNAVLVRGAAARLTAWQGNDGLLMDIPGTPPNFAFNGLAGLAVHRAQALGYSREPRGPLRLDPLLAGIESAQGILFGSSSINRQNNDLSGWPWHAGTSNWVEPTAWCTLALKKAGTAAARGTVARVREAERLLIDRCCAAGGWNYGNSNMLGKELAPYVAATAPALLALQDRGALPEVAKSVAWLAANWRRELSTMALSLALVAMTAHHAAADDVLRELRARLEAAGPPANLASCAQALYALNGARHAFAAFLS